ncbi:hypothetical protein SEA_NICEHOUSE_152 [Rhodococcus phage NiceHouse]|nr:hypothetical protein SEA_NICEHOUSE_152 [Rhodococcus phage NiceHouse]
MSLTVFAFLFAGFAAVGLIIGVIFSTDKKPRDSAWSYMLAALCAGTLVASCVVGIWSVSNNQAQSTRNWEQNCFDHGGEVVKISGGTICLEPGYKFVDIPSKT